MIDGSLFSEILPALTARTDIKDQKEVLLQAAVHVKRHRGTSVDLLQLVEMLGLEAALVEHTDIVGVLI